MSPPTYGDLGKQARDVFGKGYNFGVVKLECTSKSQTGVEMTSGGSHVLESGKVNGNVETKYKCSEHGLTFTEAWTTDNMLKTEVALDCKFKKGLKLVLNSSFLPASGVVKGTFKSTYKADLITLNGDSSLDTCPVLNGAAVIGYKKWMLGGQVGFDSAKSKLTKTNFSVGFSDKDFTLHTFCNDGVEYGGSLHHKMNKDLEGAVDVGYSNSSNLTKFGLGCKYSMDSSSVVRAKVNNFSQVGLGYQHTLRDGVKLTFSTMLDAKNFAGGKHKLGLALDFAA